MGGRVKRRQTDNGTKLGEIQTTEWANEYLSDVCEWKISRKYYIDWRLPHMENVLCN